MILSTHVGVAMIREGDSIYLVFICISSYLPIKHSFELLPKSMLESLWTLPLKQAEGMRQPFL